MNPFCKCCGYYCTFTMFIGILFFAIWAAMEATESPWFGIFQEDAYTGDTGTASEQYSQKEMECIYALIINAAVMICCFTCTYL